VIVAPPGSCFRPWSACDPPHHAIRLILDSKSASWPARSADFNGFTVFLLYW
jgi:hypothetical protein